MFLRLHVLEHVCFEVSNQTFVVSCEEQIMSKLSPEFLSCGLDFVEHTFLLSDLLVSPVTLLCFTRSIMIAMIMAWRSRSLLREDR